MIFAKCMFPINVLQLVQFVHIFRSVSNFTNIITTVVVLMKFRNVLYNMYIKSSRVFEYFHKSLYICNLPKSSDADRQRDFICLMDSLLTDSKTFFVSRTERLSSFYKEPY